MGSGFILAVTSLNLWWMTGDLKERNKWLHKLKYFQSLCQKRFGQIWFIRGVSFGLQTMNLLAWLLSETIHQSLTTSCFCRWIRNLTYVWKQGIGTAGYPLRVILQMLHHVCHSRPITMLVGLSRYFNFAWIASCNFRSLRSCWKGEVSKLPVALGRRSTQCFHVVGKCSTRDGCITFGYFPFRQLSKEKEWDEIYQVYIYCDIYTFKFTW